MTESLESVHQSDALIPSTDRVLDRLPDGVIDAVIGESSPSVRELLAELAQLEDATRGLGGARRPRWTAQSTDLLAALAREQEIIDELHRRCPDSQPATRSPDDVGVADRPD